MSQVAMSTDDGFQSLRLRKELIKEIDEFVNSERARRLGFRTRADFVDQAVREKLRELKPHMEHINTLDDHATIVDYNIERIISIYFKEDGTVWCEHDNTSDCPHIDYVLQLPEVEKALKKKDWKRKRTP
ncbi:MAG: ribbon-helix-helix domain-containing protein [Candidatus Bathyarchaeia archaeon]